jgi:hypothetical protein
MAFLPLASSSCCDSIGFFVILVSGILRGANMNVADFGNCTGTPVPSLHYVSWYVSFVLSCFQLIAFL